MTHPSKRKNISKKIRFEIFKRDKFTCQYCGQESPDVVLNVDHINPVKNGGDNNITNLITSCFDCNNGKRARLLSDGHVVKKQMKSLNELQERRNQIDMIAKWKEDLLDNDNYEIDKICEYVYRVWNVDVFAEELTPFGQIYSNVIRKTLKEAVAEIVKNELQEAKVSFKEDNKNEVSKGSLGGKSSKTRTPDEKRTDDEQE